MILTEKHAEEMVNSLNIPMVIEREAGGERGYDLFSRLLKDRIVILGTPINDAVSTIIVGQLLFLQSVDPKKDIQFYINCPGGLITAGLAIYDTMQMLSCDVRTVSIGQASSMGAVLATAGTKGKRSALPHARFMLHQPAGGTEGTALDIGVQAREIMRNREILNKILVTHTGQKIKRIEDDTSRDFYMSAEEAQAYGLVDEILNTAKKDS